MTRHICAGPLEVGCMWVAGAEMERYVTVRRGRGMCDPISTPGLGVVKATDHAVEREMRPTGVPAAVQSQGKGGAFAPCLIARVRSKEISDDRWFRNEFAAEVRPLNQSHEVRLT